MLRIKNVEEFNVILHEIIHIAAIIRNIENGNLTEGQKLLLHGCETRLLEIKEHLLQTIENNEKGG